MAVRKVTIMALLVAVLGMIYTACCARSLLLLLRTVRRQTESVIPYAVQR